MSQFWRLITKEFNKATNNTYQNLDKLILSMVTARIEHISACSTGTEPEGGDLNLAINAWIKVLREKDQLKQAKKRSADKILADAKAASIDRDNMKKAISQKRARDKVSSDEDDDLLDNNKLLDSLHSTINLAINTT